MFFVFSVFNIDFLCAENELVWLDIEIQSCLFCIKIPYGTVNLLNGIPLGETKSERKKD